MTQAIKDTDFFVLSQFRDAANALRQRMVAENTPPLERQPLIKAMVGPFLKKLADNGWSQRDRMLTLIEIWNEK